VYTYFADGSDHRDLTHCRECGAYLEGISLMPLRQQDDDQVTLKEIMCIKCYRLLFTKGKNKVP